MNTDLTGPASRSRDAVLQDFHSGGGFLFPFRQGYDAMRVILERAPKEVWRRDEEFLGALILYLVKQGQALRAKSYMTAVDLEFEKTDYSTISELLLALHLGEPVSEEKLREWRRLERSLSLSEPLLSGLYFNAMMAMQVRLGHVSEARIAGQQAISCYREDGHVYLEHFIHIHLADLDVTEGRLHRAQRGLATAERCLEQSGLLFGNERDVIEIIRLAIHYERGAFETVCAKAAYLRNKLISGDSWSELFLQLARISVLSTYFLKGSEAALLDLGEFQADYARRHIGEARAMEALRAMIQHLEWQSDAAERTLEHLRTGPMDSSIGAILARELECAIGLSLDEPGDTPRGRIVGALHKARHVRGDARRAILEDALRIAFDEGQVAPFLEHRDVFLGLSATLSRSDRRRHQGRLGRMTNRVLRMVSDSYVVPSPYRDRGFNRRQYRVAAALVSGASNKQIARQLGTTESTVKYHLTSIYRLAGVNRRVEFIEFANEIELNLQT